MAAAEHIERQIAVAVVVVVAAEDSSGAKIMNILATPFRSYS